MKNRQVLIVLGAAMWPDEQPSPSLLRRARKAAAFWHSEDIDLIIASGGQGTYPPSEAEMIRRILHAEGVPLNRILLEDQSHTTRENARNSLKLIAGHSFERIIVVSDGYHLPRAKITFAQEGVSVQVVSARDCTPRATPVAFLRACLRECAALPLYLLKRR